MDYAEAAASIARTFEEAGHPLDGSQRTILAGAISVWLDRAREEGRLDQESPTVEGRFLDLLRAKLHTEAAEELKRGLLTEREARELDRCGLDDFPIKGEVTGA